MKERRQTDPNARPPMVQVQNRIQKFAPSDDDDDDDDDQS
jgi:hypothetical protein